MYQFSLIYLLYKSPSIFVVCVLIIYIVTKTVIWIDRKLYKLEIFMEKALVTFINLISGIVNKFKDCKYSVNPKNIISNMNYLTDDYSL